MSLTVNYTFLRCHLNNFCLQTTQSGTLLRVLNEDAVVTHVTSNVHREEKLIYAEETSKTIICTINR